MVFLSHLYFNRKANKLHFNSNKIETGESNTSLAVILNPLQFVSKRREALTFLLLSRFDTVIGKVGAKLRKKREMGCVYCKENQVQHALGSSGGRGAVRLRFARCF